MAKAFYVLTAGKLEERQVAAGLGEDIGIRPPPGPRILQVSEALHVTLRLPKPAQVDAAARATHGSTSEAHLKHLSRTFPGCSLPNWVLEP